MKVIKSCFNYLIAGAIYSHLITGGMLIIPLVAAPKLFYLHFLVFTVICGTISGIMLKKIS